MFRTADSEDTSRSTSPAGESESPSSDEPLPAGSPLKKSHHREITLKMIMKELFFCLAFALATYGALHNSPPKILKHPEPVRFFSSDSPVIDWYRGQLTQALAAVNRAEVSFVMYYAPWDAECQHVRSEFEKTARLLSDRVYFSAINCWNPGSECRLQHNKLPSWPIIMAYTVTSRGVLYKGPKDVQSMANFLELIMRPLKRVANTEDLVSLLSICDAVAIGYTPLSESSQYYSAWYHTALKAREFDPFGELCFAAVTSQELAADLGAESTPAARLMLWNETIDYPGELSTWNSSSLLSWALGGFSQPAARIMPMWRKAFSFQRYVDGSPILMLFTPLNPIYEQIPNYALLREVAMEYYNCENNENNQWVSELLKLQQVQRLLYQQRDVKRFCKEYKFKKPPPAQNLYKKEVLSQYPWYNSTEKNQKPGLFNSLYKRGLALSKIIQNSEADFAATADLLEECSSKLFPVEKDLCGYYEHCQSLEDNLNEKQAEDLRSSMLPLEDDLLSPENLIQDQVKHYCKLMQFAISVSPQINPGKESANFTHITGLSCAKNFSLYFLVVDSVRNYHFAESLGVDITEMKDKTAAVILDSKHESQYVLSGDYSAASIREFIANFTSSRLQRALRDRVEATHTHVFTTTDVADTGHSVVVDDLTSASFRRLVASPGQLTIVAVCGGACNAHVPRALASGARLLRACGVPVRIARIDAHAHDLPWHLTPPAHPALLLFPPDRGREAALSAPPRQQRISTSLVVALALRALGAPAHLRVRLQLCAANKTVSSAATCLRELRQHVTALVARHLRWWRRARGALRRPLRRALRRRLALLHPLHLHIHLVNVSDLHTNQNLHRLHASLHDLAKHWDIETSLLKTLNTPVS